MNYQALSTMAVGLLSYLYIYIYKVTRLALVLAEVQF